MTGKNACVQVASCGARNCWDLLPEVRCFANGAGWGPWRGCDLSLQFPCNAAPPPSLSNSPAGYRKAHHQGSLPLGLPPTFSKQTLWQGGQAWRMGVWLGEALNPVISAVRSVNGVTTRKVTVGQPQSSTHNAPIPPNPLPPPPLALWATPPAPAPPPGPQAMLPPSPVPCACCRGGGGGR